jgi:hypothetical protein
MKEQRIPQEFAMQIQTPVTFPETGNTTPGQKGDCGTPLSLKGLATNENKSLEEN